MTALTVKIFPACAVLISVFACFFPAALSGLGFLIVPLLGLIMAGIGATLLHDRHSLGPHDARTALGKAVVAAQTQLVRATVGRAVTALHRLIGDAIGGHLAANAKRRIQNIGRIRPRQGDTRLAAEAFVLLLVFGNAVCHVRTP